MPLNSRRRQHFNAIKARCADGVLEIEIPKQPRVAAKRIAVTVKLRRLDMAATEYCRPPSAFTSPMRLRMHTIIRLRRGTGPARLTRYRSGDSAGFGAHVHLPLEELMVAAPMGLGLEQRNVRVFQ
jgi:hypothetical protein